MKKIICIFIVSFSCMLQISGSLYSSRSFPRVVITQYFQSRSFSQLSFSEQVSRQQARRYADRHGYDYKLIQTNETYFQDIIGLHSVWVKQFAIYHLLMYDRYDYVVYVGADYIFLNLERDIVKSVNKWNRNSVLYVSFEPTAVFDMNFQVWRSKDMVNSSFSTECLSHLESTFSDSTEFTFTSSSRGGSMIYFQGLMKPSPMFPCQS